MTCIQHQELFNSWPWELSMDDYLVHYGPKQRWVIRTCCLQKSKGILPHWIQDMMLLMCELGFPNDFYWHNPIAIDIFSIGFYAEFYAGYGVQSVGWALISLFPFWLSFSIGYLEGFGRRLAERNDEQIQWKEASSNLYK